MRNKKARALRKMSRDNKHYKELKRKYKYLNKNERSKINGNVIRHNELWCGS